MKKGALSASVSVLAVLILVANIRASCAPTPEERECLGYVSGISRAECFVCGENQRGPTHWGEDNLGIVNLNTFEVLYLEINHYDDAGQLMAEPAGYLSSSGLTDRNGESAVHAFAHPDCACADVRIFGVQYAIDRDSVQNNLCQSCLDAIHNPCASGQPPVEYAIISFEDRTIQTLLHYRNQLSAGHYGIDCAFGDDGKIELLIRYCPT